MTKKWNSSELAADAMNRIPYQRAKLAMGVKATGMHDRLQDIQRRHWHRLPPRPERVPCRG